MESKMSKKKNENMKRCSEQLKPWGKDLCAGNSRKHK